MGGLGTIDAQPYEQAVRGRQPRRITPDKGEDNMTEPIASNRLLQLNAPVPDFTAKTTQGMVTLSEWNPDKWVILFSHPADFTPVCTTEFMAFAKLQEEFDRRGVALLGNSIDSVHSHIAWVMSIKQNFGVDIKFPIIADLDMKVSSLFGMVHEASSDTAAIRAVFVIDPQRKLRAMIYYPLNLGRNFDEILRIIDALQTAEQHGVAMPADWRLGQPVIVPSPTTVEGAQARLKDDSIEVVDWYFSRKTL
jgi:peroxiredoxin 2/4